MAQGAWAMLPATLILFLLASIGRFASTPAGGRSPSRITNRKGTHFQVLSWKHIRAFTLTFALVRASLWLHLVVVPALWWQMC